MRRSTALAWVVFSPVVLGVCLWDWIRYGDDPRAVEFRREGKAHVVAAINLLLTGVASEDF